ncbi:hypothetical protein MMC07_001343 [Pseudocyphellaria aurata]|nr:hypothetical protein [Pseudocyphellaria aurata]
MPSIDEGQIFTTLLDFKKALRDWAIEKNFTPHILDSDSHRVRAGCRSSPDCPFRIRANYSEKRGNARVTTCDDVHNCVSTSEQLISQTIKRPEAGKLKFLVEAVPKIIDMEEPITTTIIIDAVKRKYGQNLPLRQAQKVKRALGCKPHGPCRECRRMGHSKKTCPQLYPGGVNPNAIPRSDPQNLDTNLDDSGMQIDSTNGVQVEPNVDNRPRADHRCTRCFQPGHTRNHCPSEATPASLAEGAGVSQAGRGPPTNHGIGQAPDEVSIDPNLRSSAQRAGRGTQPPSSSTAAQATDPQPNQTSMPHHEQPPRTSQDTRLEAARLMQQAARLMQEAARLNAEAAKLTLSAANS